MANILVTGGAGYIGAHVVRELQKNNHNVTVIDDLSTGMQEHLSKDTIFIEGDFGNRQILDKIFREQKIDIVIHMAASIEVGESAQKPLQYLDNNTVKTHGLLQSMSEAGINKLIFSSTAAIYGIQDQVPIPESANIGPLDPYSYSKMLSEKLITYYSRFAGLQAVIFRYFNACGSDFDKDIRDGHNSHLIPHIMGVMQSSSNELTIFGDDYPTPDGTTVRDYVHVLDIASAHIVALQNLEKLSSLEIFNIGTGQGKSVREVIAVVEQVTGKSLNIKVGPRRPGDVPITVADNSRIKNQLGFEPKHSDLKTIIETSLP